MRGAQSNRFSSRRMSEHRKLPGHWCIYIHIHSWIDTIRHSWTQLQRTTSCKAVTQSDWVSEIEVTLQCQSEMNSILQCMQCTLNLWLFIKLWGTVCITCIISLTKVRFIQVRIHCCIDAYMQRSCGSKSLVCIACIEILFKVWCDEGPGFSFGFCQLCNFSVDICCVDTHTDPAPCITVVEDNLFCDFISKV